MGICFLELQKIVKLKINKIKLYWLPWTSGGIFLINQNETEKALLVNETMYSSFSFLSAYTNSVTGCFSNKLDIVLL